MMTVMRNLDPSLRRLIGAAVLVVPALLTTSESALAAAEAPTPPEQNWPFDGIFGHFDIAATQRGLQVYAEVCRSCHSLDYVHYRDLRQIGYSEEEVEAFAAQWEVEAGPNEEGEMYMRPAEPRDRFVAPFPNEQAAEAANNGVMPPDLSLMYKARPDGADYIYGLLTGYAEAPEGFEMPVGTYYNKYFPGHRIAMPQPLFDGMVEYADGTEATVEQMSRDLTNFLAWTAEPKLEHRKATGISVMLFMIVLTGLFYATKRKVWSKLH